MARNKYPEETAQKILETSLRLFLEKGYEKTTVQDIVDNLGGLSKGAIYHHFKSKEDIFIAASNYLFSQDSTDEWAAIRDNPDMTALQKARQLFLTTINDPTETIFRSFGAKQAEIPRFVVDKLKRSAEITAPKYLQPILEQGVAEGGLQTEFPGELAQIILMMTNIWFDASIFPVTNEEYLRKLFFMAELFEKFGVKDLFNDELTRTIQTAIIQDYNQKLQEG